MDVAKLLGLSCIVNRLGCILLVPADCTAACPRVPSLVPGRGTKYNFCGYPGCEADEVLLSHQELGGKSGTFNLNSDGNLILISNIEAQQWTREWPKNCICAEAGPILTFFR